MYSCVLSAASDSYFYSIFWVESWLIASCSSNCQKMHFGVAIWNESTSNIQKFSFLFMKNTKSEDGKAAFKGPSLVFACSLWRINPHNSKSEHLTNIKKAHSLLGTSHNYLTNILKHCNNQQSVKWATAPTFWRVWAHCTSVQWAQTRSSGGGPEEARLGHVTQEGFLSLRKHPPPLGPFTLASDLEGEIPELVHIKLESGVWPQSENWTRTRPWHCLQWGLLGCIPRFNNRVMLEAGKH